MKYRQNKIEIRIKFYLNVKRYGFQQVTESDLLMTLIIDLFKMKWSYSEHNIIISTQQESYWNSECKGSSILDWPFNNDLAQDVA